MTLRNMVVVRAPSTTNCPMVRIANRMLKLHGFAIGVPIEVTYQQNIITLKIIDYANTIQKPSSPVSLSNASVTSGKSGTREVTQYERRAEPCEIAPSQTVPSTIQPLRYVLTGSWHYGRPQNARVSRRQMRVEHGRQAHRSRAREHSHF